METKLTVQKRELSGKKCKKLRKENLIPGIIYGYKHESIPVSIDKETLKAILQKDNVATPFEITIGKEIFPVVVKEIQKDVLTGEVIHIDLLIAEKGHPIVFDVPVKLHGVSIAVKNGWGVIMQALDYVKLKAKPEDIIPQIEIDVSVLKKVGDNIAVEDLELPEGVKPVNATETKRTIVTIATFQKVTQEAETEEEEEKEAEAETETAQQ